MTPAEQRASLDEVAAKLTSAIRSSVLDPGEVAIATIERIRADAYRPDVAAHAIEQLEELAAALGRKLENPAQTIARLCGTLGGFEVRLGQMSRPGRH